MLKSSIFVISALALSALAAGAATVEEGDSQYRHGRYAEAESTLRQVSQANPDDPVAHEKLALTLAALKKPEEAQSHIQMASEKGLSEDRVKAAQAKVALEQRDISSASSLVDEALATNGENADALHYRGMVRVAQKNFAGAVQDFEKSLELNPDNPYAHYYAGVAYNGLNRKDQMVSHLEAFLRLAPEAPEADKVRSLMRAFR